MEMVIKFANQIIELSLVTLLSVLLISLSSVHPLILCLGLIIFTLSLSSLLSMFISKWIAYAIILIFLGGMMVIFIYTSTLASNEKLTFSFPPYYFYMLLGLTLSVLIPQPSGLNPLTHLFSAPSSPFLYFLTLFLLFTLFVVIFLAQGFKGALMKFQ